MLEISGLRIALGGRPAIVDGIDLAVGAGERLGLVGESGCGKSLTCMAALGLLPPGLTIVGGRVALDGVVIAGDGAPARPRGIAGRRIAMVFQDATSALNPLRTVGWQLAEPMIVHRGLSPRAARRAAMALLAAVGIADADRRMRQFPFQLSGGLNQRVMIAMALAAEPAVLIADEPTTALDVTVQAQILDLLDRLQAQWGFALLLVTHDLGVVAETVDRLAVMYAGRIVESGPVAALLGAPAHPYTRGLLASMPEPDGPVARLQAIPGQVPTPDRRGTGCAFAPRCAHAMPDCALAPPSPREIGIGRGVACFYPLAPAVDQHARAGA